MSPSTVCRELERNSLKRGGYHPEKAEEFTQERKEGFAKDRHFNAIVEKRVKQYLLQEQWSPEEIVGYCAKHNLEMVSVERIYQYIRMDKVQGGSLYTHLHHQLKHRKRPVGGDTKVKIKDRVSIDQRPESVNNREEFGHWEADLISGKAHDGFILTLTERI